MKIFLWIYLMLLYSHSIFASAMDCTHPKTHHQHFICHYPQLKQLDTEMNYQLRFWKNKFLMLNQKNWNGFYMSCSDNKQDKHKDAVENCKNLLTSRIQFFKDLHNSKIYIDNQEFFAPSGSTLMIVDRNGTKYLRYFGGWMPSGFMKPKDMKGYPYDGYWCDDEIPLKSKDGKIYQVNRTKDSDNYDSFNGKFNIKYNNKELIMNGYIQCGIRASVRHPGNFKRFYQMRRKNNSSSR